MSKWNVKTADGRVTDLKAIAAPSLALAPSSAPTGMDMEADNPVFMGGAKAQPKSLYENYGATEGGAPPSAGKCGRCGTFLETRRGRLCAAYCVFSIILFAILIGVLYPRFPTVDIDRKATAQSIDVSQIFCLCPAYGKKFGIEPYPPEATTCEN